LKEGEILKAKRIIASEGYDQLFDIADKDEKGEEMKILKE